MPTISTNRPKELNGGYALRSSHVVNVSTGAVATIAARTATAGQLLSFRWSSSTAVKCFLKYVGARFIATTAYGTPQETGCDLIIAHSYTVDATGGTAVDVGSTVAATNKLQSSMATSLITAGSVRVATASAITAGTHTLNANPIGLVSGWTSAIGIMVPEATSGARSGYATLWDCNASSHQAPIMLTTDQGFIVRNTILMGATGVGRWDFTLEWDEGTPNP